MQYINSTEAGEMFFYPVPIHVQGYFFKKISRNNREGYNSGCTGDCLDKLKNFNFIKMDIDNAYTLRHLVTKPGIYRFSVVEGDNPQCALFYSLIESESNLLRKNKYHSSGALRFSKNKPGYCVAPKKITQETLVSEYAYEQHSFSRVSPYFLNIMKFETLITNLKTQKIVALLKTYHFRPWIYDVDATTVHEAIAKLYQLLRLPVLQRLAVLDLALSKAYK